MKLRSRKAAVVVGLLSVFAIAGCSSVSTEPDQTALQYEGGSFSDKKFSMQVPPSKKEYAGPSDRFYTYPVGQRSYDATGAEGSERGPITSSSKDSVEMATPLAVTFDLKTDEESLKEFHEKIGLKYQAWYLEDEEESAKDPTGISPGWRRMLDFYMGQSLEATVDRIQAGYEWRKAYGDASIRTAVETAIKAELPAIVQAKMGGAYFENYAVQVQRPVPTNPALLKAIADNQNQVAAAEAAKAKAEADEKTAKAQIALQQAEAQKKKADISAYGSVAEYNKAQAIEKGINPYQPTYIVPGTAPAQTK